MQRRLSSIQYIKRHFGFERIVGVDLSETKVRRAREQGNSVVLADATKLRFREPVVAASFLFHFLEHLYTLADAKEVLLNAVGASRDFVLVRQPFFSADDELFRHGLKFAWSTWHGHPNRMTGLDFHTTLSALQADGLISHFRIGFAIPVTDSSCNQILPISADPEAPFYAPELHGPKPMMQFDALYREICVAIAVSSQPDWKRLETAGRVSEWVYRSDLPED